MAAQSSIFSKSPSKDGFVDMKDYSAIEILQKSPHELSCVPIEPPAIPSLNYQKELRY